MTAASSPSRIPTPPRPRTPLIGREADVAAVRALVTREDVPIVTVVGPGGVGKTRLALAVAAQVRDTFDGVWFVNLAPLTDAALVMPTIAAMLDVRAHGAQAVGAALADVLRERRALLVLDNLEQVLDAAHDLAALLDLAPAVTLLVTSRAPLRLSGEHVYPLAPLALPGAAQVTDLAALARTAAIALFMQRAQAARPDVQLSAATAPAIAEICRQLDGLPLAIELAAVRLNLLAPQALLARMTSRLALLTGGPRDAPARQQTLRATIAWSHDLLTDADQRLFRQLAVFAGGWSLDAAAAVCDADLEIFEGHARLVEQQLVRPIEQPDGAPRFAMLETLREYGLERLAASREDDATRRRHAAHFLGVAERAAPALNQGGDQRRAFDELDREQHNLRAALATTLDRGDTAALLRLTVALSTYWRYRGLYHEARRWLEAALVPGADAPVALRAAAAVEAGSYAQEQGDFDRAEELLTEALADAWDGGNRALVSEILEDLGFNAVYRANYVRADALYAEALDLARAVGSPVAIAARLGSMSLGRLLLGDLPETMSLIEESVELTRGTGDRARLSHHLYFLGFAALWSGDIARATAAAEECSALARESGDDLLAAAHQVLGYIALEQDNVAQARASFSAALPLYQAIGNPMTVAECLEGMGGVAAAEGRPSQAARLLGAANRLRDSIRSPVPPPRIERIERTLALIHAGLGDDAFASAWADGTALTSDAAIAAALEPGAAPAAPSAVPFGAGLSTRELEVLRLLAEGRSDKEIAQALFISPHTVMRHVQHILAKLDVSSRTAAATLAVRHQLG